MGPVMDVSGLLHPELSLLSNSITFSTVGTAITSALRDSSLLSLDGICKFATGLRDAPWKYKDGVHPRGRIFYLYQPVRVKNTRGGKEKWIAGTIVAVKGPETYLVRVPGNDRCFVYQMMLQAWVPM